MEKTPQGKLMRDLAEHLEKMPAILRFVERREGRSAKEVAWEIAHGLVDIQESAETLFKRLVPRLLQSSPPEEDADNILHDIGEEYRHILYHLTNNAFFSYVVGDGDGDGAREPIEDI